MNIFEYTILAFKLTSLYKLLPLTNPKNQEKNKVSKKNTSFRFNETAATASVEDVDPGDHLVLQSLFEAATGPHGPHQRRQVLLHDG